MRNFVEILNLLIDTHQKNVSIKDLAELSDVSFLEMLKFLKLNNFPSDCYKDGDLVLYKTIVHLASLLELDLAKGRKVYIITDHCVGYDHIHILPGGIQLDGHVLEKFQAYYYDDYVGIHLKHEKDIIALGYVKVEPRPKGHLLNSVVKYN